MLAQLRQTLQKLEKPSGYLDSPAILPLGISCIDAALGGGLVRGALHEIAAASEAHIGAAAGFAVGIAALSSPPSHPTSLVIPGRERKRANPESITQAAAYGAALRADPLGASQNDMERAGRGALVWIAEDMALTESGALYGPGLATFGLRPERLLTVAAACRSDLLWAMEEALRCRAVCAVIGELRHDAIDMVAVRRLSLAAATSGTLALLLRASPPNDASTAATRWIVSAASSSFADGSHTPLIPAQAGIQNPSHRHGGTGSPLSRGRAGDVSTTFAVELARNRRGPLGSWILQWSNDDEHFVLATPAQPMAAPAADGPHRAVA